MSVILCLTCHAKPAVRLTHGSLDGPYWCSAECKKNYQVKPFVVNGEALTRDELYKNTTVIEALERIASLGDFE